jgi:NADPH:quinone reductase-like Zn-dependent oxidoreductase
MKAVFMNRHGGPDVLIFGDMPDPGTKPGEAVVDIAAASVNEADWKVRTGQSYPVSQFPYILGRDFSEVIAAVGDGVVDLRPGDAVMTCVRCGPP